MNRKYDKNDFQLIIEKRKTIEQIAKKYGVSVNTVARQMNRAGYHISKRKIIIVSPYEIRECDSVSECAKQLGVSYPTIRKALKGERVKILEDLEISLREEKANELDI